MLLSTEYSPLTANYFQLAAHCFTSCQDFNIGDTLVAMDDPQPFEPIEVGALPTI